jgi:uncharacterized protein YgbK (DUF1537 family)
MALALGCIADDYTGASDLANTLTRAGLRTAQTIGIPPASFRCEEFDAIVVALKSRSIPSADAVRLVRAAHGWLKDRGAERILFKICSTFDSTDEGNIGPVTDALREDIHGDRPGVILVTPAFPETGRTVYMGHLFVGAVPLHESPLKDHPLNPMRDSNLVRVLHRQSQSRIGLISRAVVAKGAAAVRSELTELARAGIGAAIVDAVSDADLETIGTVAAEQPLTTGASGLGLGIARALVATGRVKPHPEQTDAAMRPVGGFIAILAGSCSQATLQQIAAAEQVMPVLRLDSARLLEGAGETERAVAYAAERLGQGPVIIASSAEPDQVAATQMRHGREIAGHRIEQAMAEIATRLVEIGVRRLVVAGGETSGAVVDRLGLRAFIVGPEVAPGVPLLRTTGTEGEDMLVVLKSGNFGGSNFFSKAVALMT